MIAPQPKIQPREQVSSSSLIRLIQNHCESYAEFLSSSEGFFISVLLWLHSSKLHCALLQV